MISGRPSRFMSPIACAVLNALSGNQTWPACCSSAICAPSKAGSAGTIFRASASPPRDGADGEPAQPARPVTTDRPQSVITSMNDPRSKKRRSISRGSCGAEVGREPSMGRWMVSNWSPAPGTEQRRAPALGNVARANAGCCETPRTSSDTTRCDTPLAPITRGPPICALDVYTSRPSTLFSAEAPVKIKGASGVLNHALAQPRAVRADADGAPRDVRQRDCFFVRAAGGRRDLARALQALHALPAAHVRQPPAHLAGALVHHAVRQNPPVGAEHLVVVLGQVDVLEPLGGLGLVHPLDPERRLDRLVQTDARAGVGGDVHAGQALRDARSNAARYTASSAGRRNRTCA